MKSMRTLYIPAFLTGLENVARRCYLPMGKENRFGLYKGKFEKNAQMSLENNKIFQNHRFSWSTKSLKYLPLSASF